MEIQLNELVKNLVESNKIQQEILDKIKGLEGTINRKFIVEIDVESCFRLLSNGLTIDNINSYNKKVLDLESNRLFDNNLTGRGVFGKNVIQYNRKTLELENNIVHKINNNVNLNHICICFNKKRYLEIFIIPIEKDISEIHINGINIQIDYFQNYLSLINSILEKNKKL
jgi:hypothetical protein